MFNFVGDLCGLQLIAANKKRFSKGSAAKDAYYIIGNDSEILYLCEGYATANSVHQASNCLVCIAFSTNNIVAVAQIMLEKYPDKKIILCADDDRWTEGNPGISNAKKAAEEEAENRDIAENGNLTKRVVEVLAAQTADDGRLAVPQDHRRLGGTFVNRESIYGLQ